MAGKIGKHVKSDFRDADTMKQSEDMLLFRMLLFYSIRSYSKRWESLLNSTHVLLSHQPKYKSNLESDKHPWK